MYLPQDTRSDQGMRRRLPSVVGRVATTAAYLTALAVVVAALAACGTARQRGGAASGSPPAPPPSPTQVSVAPTPPGTGTVELPPATGAGQPATRTGQPSTCRASDFRLLSVASDGAMGSMYTTVAVVYQGHGSCPIVSTPTLRYRTPAGRLAQVPTVREGDGADTLTVPPGQRLFFVIRTVSGYGGYGPTSPQCAHPATYRQVQLRLGDGYLDLRDWQLTVLCGEISVRDWAPGTAP